MSAIAVLPRARRVSSTCRSEERPRERLFRHGAAALSSRELLAVVLGSGSARASALDLAEASSRDGLRGLAARSLAELEGEPGLGPAKAARVLATLELGARAGRRGRAAGALVPHARRVGPLPPAALRLRVPSRPSASSPSTCVSA